MRGAWSRAADRTTTARVRGGLLAAPPSFIAEWERLISAAAEPPSPDSPPDVATPSAGSGGGNEHCFLLCICGGMVLQSTCTNAACQLTLVLASVANLPIALFMMRRDSLDEYAFIRKANGGLPGQPAMSLLLQCCCSARGIGGLRNWPTCSSRGE